MKRHSSNLAEYEVRESEAVCEGRYYPIYMAISVVYGLESTWVWKADAAARCRELNERLHPPQK